MRRFLSYLGLAALGALGAAAVIAAAPGPVSPAVSTAAHEQAALSQIHIAPHRAIYDMALASVKNGSNITDVSGRMLFEWRDMCDGWAIQQHMQLHFSYSDGDDQNVVSTELTWESKDGKSYNYNIRRVTNGEETENYRGKAVRNDDGSVTATYTAPEGKTMQLPAGTIFPSTHTEMILREAAQGGQFFSRRVFDGSDDDGSSEISAFISPQRAVATEAGLSDKLKTNPLLADAAWPVHMAFFSPDGETGVPDYEMDLNLLPNGIARHMKIDYGDFSVTGALADIESLPPQKCP